MSESPTKLTQYWCWMFRIMVTKTWCFKFNSKYEQNFYKWDDLHNKRSRACAHQMFFIELHQSGQAWQNPEWWFDKLWWPRILLETQIIRESWFSKALWILRVWKSKINSSASVGGAAGVTGRNFQSPNFFFCTKAWVWIRQVKNFLWTTCINSYS